jgi:hypothetical protein
MSTKLNPSEMTKRYRLQRSTLLKRRTKDRHDNLETSPMMKTKVLMVEVGRGFGQKMNWR